MDGEETCPAQSGRVKRQQSARAFLAAVLSQEKGTLQHSLIGVLGKWRHYFANKDPSSQSYGFSSSHVQM